MANQTEPARFLGSSARQHKGIYGFFLLLIPGAGSSKGAHSGRLFTERNTMSEETLVAHCSPVLAGLKTANMFNADCDDPQSLCLQLRELNLRLGPKGVRILPLRFSGSKARKFHELTPSGRRTPSVRPARPSLPCVGWK